ncbi:unknown [Clostridium sp. CAG:921]|nr:unknown [Clostridium sp. CAG:921]
MSVTPFEFVVLLLSSEFTLVASSLFSLFSSLLEFDTSSFLLESSESLVFEITLLLFFKASESFCSTDMPDFTKKNIPTERISNTAIEIATKTNLCIPSLPLNFL